MTAAEQAPHPRAGPAQAASNQPVSSSVEIDKTPQFHWVDIDPLPPSPLYSNRRRASIRDINLISLDDNNDRLFICPGDVLLADYEEELPAAWTGSFARKQRDYDVTSALSRAARQLGKKCNADIVIFDVGPLLS